MAREMTRAELLAVDGTKPMSRAALIDKLGKFAYTSNRNGTIHITDGWDDRNIVDLQLPQFAKIAKPVTSKVPVNQHVAPQLKRAFELIERLGLLTYVLTYDGCWVARHIGWNPQNDLSTHSWGAAIDLNAGWNGMYRPPAKEGTKGSLWEIVGIMAACGFGWGGWWTHSTDGMHFEIWRIVPEAELPVLVEQPVVTDRDVAPWAEDDVEALKATGILTGYPDGRFGGGRTVTRNELAVVQARALKYVDRNYSRLGTPRAEGEIRG